MFNSAVGLGIGGQTDEYDPYDTKGFRESVFAPVAIKQEPVEPAKRKREDGKPGKDANKKARKTDTSDQQSETTEPRVRRSKKDKKRQKKDKHHKRDKSGGHAPGGVDSTSEVLQTSEGANATPAPGVDPPTHTTTPVIPPPVLDTDPPLRATTPVIPPPVLDTVPPLLPAPSRSSLVPDIAQHRDVPNEAIGTVNPANLQKQDQNAMSPSGRLHIGDCVPGNENDLGHLAEGNFDEETSGIGNSTRGTRTDGLGSDEADDVDDETGDEETDDDEDSPTDSSQRSSSE
jgi:hypothetical protein